MNFLDWLGLTYEQVSNGFYGFIGWSASAISVRPKGVVDAVVSLFVAIMFAEAAADGVAKLIARHIGGEAADWTKTSALVVGFGGILSLQIILNRLHNSTKGKAHGADR